MVVPPRQGAATTEPAVHAILPTENEAWVFGGSMGEHVTAAWPRALAAITEATGAEADAVRAFLDSRHGRHFADDVMGRLDVSEPLDAAIGATTARWMGWRISRRTSREAGIPAGLPYLTGFVLDAQMALEATA